MHGGYGRATEVVIGSEDDVSRYHHARSSAQRDKDRRIIARGEPACYICGKPIDYSLTWPDAMCFVVDHKEPLSRGGADDLSNKGPAHKVCNDKKRARQYAPIVRRSGSLG